MVQSEWREKIQMEAGLMKMSKIRVVKTPKLIIGRRKLAQMKAGRTRK
jgi:hypothetical protein